MHCALAAAGAYLAYDAPGPLHPVTDELLADLVAALADAGHGDRVLVGADTLTPAGRAASDAGCGAAGLLRRTLGRLERRVGAAAARAPFAGNAARAFAWRRAREPLPQLRVAAEIF